MKLLLFIVLCVVFVFALDDPEDSLNYYSNYSPAAERSELVSKRGLRILRMGKRNDLFRLLDKRGMRHMRLG
uniref:Secreted peptide prohormone 5 n=1 Tax=Schmidtea mediterranea TaxID=79327 RepID=E3T7V0_SCHMD|nr:secreted peptide prohormone 5 [Schmidtea mediterranea]